MNHKGAITWFFAGALLLLPACLSVAVAAEDFSVTPKQLIGPSVVESWGRLGGFSKNKTSGSRGDDVRLLQQFLKNISASGTLAVSGTYEQKTRTALASFQQRMGILPTGRFDKDTRELLNAYFSKRLCPLGDGKYGVRYDLAVVNNFPIPLDYVPDNLTIFRTSSTLGIMCMKKEAAENLRAMIEAAKKEKIRIMISSGYRSAEHQEYLGEFWNEKRENKWFADVATPGYSEHQLGTAADLTGYSVRYKSVPGNFETTPEYRWLQSHAHEYGFILSFPKGKEYQTGYAYEPWHYRYVGQDVARLMRIDKISTLAEYVAKYKNVSK